MGHNKFEGWSEDLLKARIRSLNADIQSTQQSLSFLNLELAIVSKELAKRESKSENYNFS